MAEKSPKRPGIFKGLANAFLKEEYRTVSEETNVPSDTNSATKTVVTAPLTQQTISQPAVSSSSMGVVNVDAMVKKILTILQQINLPGVDILELWDGAEANGGLTLENLQSTFKTLNKVVGKGQLTISGMITSGDHYKSELARLMNEDVAQKQSQRQSIIDAQAQEKHQLQTEVQDLSNQIAQLQQRMLDKQRTLASIDSKYQPQIAEIDQKVSAGTVALQQVTGIINGILSMLSNIKTA